MLKPINIGPIAIEEPVFLAPMSGVTDMPFRRLVKSFGAGLVISEMIASEAMIRATKQTMKMSSNCAEEFPMSVQLAGCEPSVMAKAAQLNVERGAAIIDINMGCPVKKVVNGDAGSALMKNLDHAASIIDAVVKAVDVPVTLKMRTGWDENHRNAPELAKIAEDLGIKLLTVHGRTRNQMYKGHSDWGFIKSVKEATNLPLIANGDINNFDDVTEVLKLSGADGIMIGRGCYGRPWFLAQAMHFIKTGERLDDPSLEVQLQTIHTHYDEMLEHYGVEIAVKMARKHFGWYTKGLAGSAEFRHRVNHMLEPAEVKLALDEFYKPLINQTEAA